MSDIDRLLLWYERHGRDLPWRRKKPDPYHVLVSEIMLQQTTVEAVKPRFVEFIGRFPELQALASASIDDVLHAWQGLGYYRRARSLHAAANQVVDRFGGELPKGLPDLESLPGIGRYTGAAIAAIAFDLPVVPVDGNIARIVSRYDALDAEWPSRFGTFQNAADKFLASSRPGDIAQALMDLGAATCRPRNPICRECPLMANCAAHRRNAVEQYPKKTVKQQRREMFAVAFVVRDRRRRLQFRRRSDGGLLGGMIELPTGEWRAKPFADMKERLAAAPVGIESGALFATQIRHVFTHIDLRLDIVEVDRGTAIDAFWHDIDSLAELALPTLTKKLLSAVDIAC